MVFASTALAGKVAVVTGGGTGIGRGIVEEMARVGAKMVIASRSTEHLEPTVAEIQGMGTACVAVQADVRDREQCANVVRRAVEEFGRVDILVNNAAGNFRVAAEELTENGWKTVLDIDLNGTFNCTQAVFPVMKEQGGGSIINILAFTDQGGPGNVHAAAAKSGIWGMTLTLATEWGRHGIRLNAITPGTVPTLGTTRNLRLGLRPGEPDDIGGEEAVAQMQGAPDEQTPLGRNGTPTDIGLAAVFLASDASGWMTGAHLHVDGGKRSGGLYSWAGASRDIENAPS